MLFNVILCVRLQPEYTLYQRRQKLLGDVDSDLKKWHSQPAKIEQYTRALTSIFRLPTNVNVGIWSISTSVDKFIHFGRLVLDDNITLWYNATEEAAEKSERGGNNSISIRAISNNSTGGSPFNRPIMTTATTKAPEHHSIHPTLNYK